MKEERETRRPNEGTSQSEVAVDAPRKPKGLRVAPTFIRAGGAKITDTSSTVTA